MPVNLESFGVFGVVVDRYDGLLICDYLFMGSWCKHPIDIHASRDVVAFTLDL